MMILYECSWFFDYSKVELEKRKGDPVCLILIV